MKWNEQEGYINYSTSLASIRSMLGVGALDFYLRPELSPYVTYILCYLNRKLINLGVVDIKTYIQEVFDIFDHGADLIIVGAAFDLAIEVGIDTGDVWIEGQEVPYMQDRFIFCWSNVLTTITQILRLSYSGLFAQEEEDCPCKCGGTRITTNKENDEWSSGIYPNDENYDWVSRDNTIKVGWKLNGSYIDQCTKCNRKY